MSRGKLIVFSGPSGVGKDSVLREFLKITDDTFLSVSMTTRSPREGEVEGKDYFFVTKEKFEQLIEDDGFIEYAQYVGNYYGTPKAPVERALCEGKNVILELETVGAMNVKELYKNAVLIFLSPPSIEILRQRLVDRGTDDGKTIEMRIKKAFLEMKLTSEYDYCIVNDCLYESAEQLKKIIQNLKNKNIEETIC